MNAYINTITMEYPRFIGDIQNEFPDWSEDQNLPDGWSNILYLDRPEINEYEACDQLPAEEQVDGSWVVKWNNPRPMTEEEVISYNKVKQFIEEQKKNMPVIPTIMDI
jgi:hypothetical protein